MAATKVKGVVLGGVNVKEKDRIINVYTLENGVISLSMKGVRGEKAKMKFAKEPFCFGEFIVELGKNMPVVTGVDIIDSFYGIASDIDKFYEGCAILGLVGKLGNESNPHIFIELIKALKALCYYNVKKYYVFNKFLLELLEDMGYTFVSDNCSSCGATLRVRYLNLQVGELVCPACKNDLSVSVSDNCFAALKLLKNTEYEKLDTLKLEQGAEESACSLLVRDYEWRTGNKVLSISS